MNQKGAIGLSINLIVVIIISVVILSLGIVFLYNLVSGAEDIKSDLDTRTQAELERLLVDQGKKVALPRHTTTLQAGESHVFGVGILNIEEAYGTSFTIEVTLSKALHENEAVMDPQPEGTDSWLLWDEGPHTIKENEHKSEPIRVAVPPDALKGTYIFNVKVFDGSNDLYGTTKKFIVNVK